MSNTNIEDLDPLQTKEWLEAMNNVISYDGKDRALYIINQLVRQANKFGINLPSLNVTPYCNTIAPQDEKHMPPDQGMFKRLVALIRWNAVVMVLRAGKYAPELGGHLASYASAAILYEVGLNYFFHGRPPSRSFQLIV